MKVTRILHASVNVAGRLETTRDFYTGLLGLEMIERPQIPGVPGSWFGAGDGQVHLVGAAPQGPPIDPVGNHYCLGVDDIAGAVRELEAAGIPYTQARQGPRGEVLQIWIADPAGNTVELQQDPSLSPEDS